MIVNKTKQGAGFIIFNNKDQVLTLVADDEIAKRNGGILDFPKGVIEDGETIWECAVRECREECGIIIKTSDLEWGLQPIQLGQLTMFLARTTDHGSLRRNPKTGLYEHQMLLWDKPAIITTSLYDYLKPIMHQAIIRTGIS